MAWFDEDPLDRSISPGRSPVHTIFPPSYHFTASGPQFREGPKSIPAPSTPRIDIALFAMSETATKRPVQRILTCR